MVFGSALVLFAYDLSLDPCCTGANLLRPGNRRSVIAALAEQDPDAFARTSKPGAQAAGQGARRDARSQPSDTPAHRFAAKPPNHNRAR